MSLDAFNRVLQGFCVDMEIDDAESIFESLSFEVDGVTVSMQYVAFLDACRFFIDLGVPAEDNEEFLRHLLGLNLQMPGAMPVQFGMDDHVTHATEDRD